MHHDSVLRYLRRGELGAAELWDADRPRKRGGAAASGRAGGTAGSAPGSDGADDAFASDAIAWRCAKRSAAAEPHNAAGRRGSPTFYPVWAVEETYGCGAV